DHVGDVVGRELPDPELPLRPRERLQQRRLVARREPEEEVLRLVRREQPEALDALGLGEDRPGVEQLVRAEPLALLHRRLAHRIAPERLCAASSSQSSPSSSSTSSVCWPSSGAGASSGCVSSNCTGLATSAKRPLSPPSTGRR